MLLALSLPDWDSIHPMIIHFPIVLLMISPLFLVLGSIMTPARGLPYRLTAFFLLLLGTASLFIAISTGEAAGELADRSGAANSVLESHEALAEKTRILFAGFSVILAGILFLPRLLRRRETRLISTVLPLSFLLLYSVGIVFLVNTAHAGGRLVHEFGVHSMAFSTDSPQTLQPETPQPKEDKD